MREAWNADALMEGVRVGTKRGEFLSALEDRVRAEEEQWTPLLRLHYPDQLDDYLNRVLVETGQRFFKKEPMDAPGYADLAKEDGSFLHNDWRPGRALVRIVFWGRRAWRARGSFGRKWFLQRNNWPRPLRLLKRLGSG